MSPQLPDLYYFNPTCDIAVGNNAISFTPARGLVQFEAEMATMPLWLAHANDYVLVPDEVDPLFVRMLTECGFEVPRFITPERLQNERPDLYRFIPWGWSRANHYDWEWVMELCDASFRSSAVAHWHAENRELMSRLTAIRLAEVVRRLFDDSLCVRLPQSTLVVKSMDDANAALDLFSGKMIFKAPWSSSGRGLMMFDVASGRLPDMRWVEGTIRQQGFVTAEPYLDKRQDVSFHFYIQPDGEVKYLGHNFFQTNDKGRFTGCIIEEFPDELILNDDGSRLHKSLTEASAALKNGLEQLSLHRLYSGPIGVDALWYRHENGLCYLHPVIETNVRYTMGLLNITLRKRLHPQAKGIWQMEQFAKGEFQVFCHRQYMLHPRVMANGKLRTGFLSMVPETGSWGAWMILK